MKRLRSILYTPGHRPALIDKVTGYGSDAVCLVLEDSVPRDRRAEARAIVGEALPRVGAATSAFVKVNALEDDGLEEDLKAIVGPGLAGIIVPKISSVDDVVRVDRLLAAAEELASIPPGRIEVLLLIETPRAVVLAFDLACAATRVASLVCGTAANGDLAGALGLVWSPGATERLYVMSKVLVDARAAGIETPLDGVWTGVGDLDGLVREATLARSLGYRGKLLIHPEQVEPVNRLFTPTEEEVEASRRVVEAFDSALAEGRAAIVVDGRMVDYAMVDTARRTLELAEAIESRR